MESINSKRLVKDYFLNSTFIGLQKIIKTQKCNNFSMWIIFNLISVSTCSYFLLQILLNYYSYSVITNIRTVNEQPMEFPGFTICDFSVEIYFYSFISKLTIANNKKNTSQFFTKYGSHCISFNSGQNIYKKPAPIISSKQGGYDDSISMRIRLSANGSFGYFIIHQRDIPPRINKDYVFAENIFKIKNGSLFEFKISKVIEQKQQEPYNSCLKDYTKFKGNTTLVEFYQKSYLNYTQTDCLNLCFELYYIENNTCNCSSELNDIWKSCYLKQTNKNISDCTHTNRLEFFSNEVVKKCEKYCPLECDSLNYVVENSIYYGESHSENEADIRLSMKNLKYTLISQQPKMDFNDLISSVGGTISLFIGISFISLFEIIELFFEVIVYFSKTGKNSIQNFKN